MPLAWNISNSEMGNLRETNSEHPHNCPDIFISAVGMKVLNEIGEGYSPTLQEFVLTEEVAEKIASEWIKEAKTSEEESDLRIWIPKLIGSSFRRAG